MGKMKRARLAAQAPKPQSGQLTPQFLASKMHLTPQQAQQLQRIVLAGQKVMYSAQTHKLMLKQLQGPDPLPYKLGQGVAGLLGILMRESNNSLPRKLLIPAGTLLVADAADFLRKSGVQVSDQDVAAGIVLMTRYVLHASGLDPNKVMAAGEQGMQGARIKPKPVAQQPQTSTPPQGVAQ